MKEIVLPYVGITYDDPVSHCKFNKGVELGFPEIEEIISCVEKLNRRKPSLIFCDISLITNLTKEGRRMLEKYNNIPFCMGLAIFVNKNRYECAEDFVNNYNSKFPFRAFTTEQEAKDWLLTLSLDC